MYKKEKHFLAPSKTKITRSATTQKNSGIVSWIWLSMIMAVLALALVAFFGRVNVTIPFSVKWILVYFVSLSLLLGSLAVLLNKSGAAIVARKNSIKKYGVFIIIVIGFGALVEVSIFLGIPKTLHYLDSEERQITVSITGKSNLPGGRRKINPCRYRVFIREFTNIPGNHLCVEKEIYEAVSESDNLLLNGDVSSFGISVKTVHVVPLERKRGL